MDHVFEVVGHPGVMAMALEALAPGGTLTFVGAAARDATFSFHPRAFLSKQQTIRGCIYGSCRPAVDFPLFVEWYLNGMLKLDELLTETIRLEQLPKQFEADPTPENIRTVVVFDE
jgi:S-(hydroxymethyl)glutathione dehydrogenase/alcohol dehydrogenase